MHRFWLINLSRPAIGRIASVFAGVGLVTALSYGAQVWVERSGFDSFPQNTTPPNVWLSTVTSPPVAPFARPNIPDRQRFPFIRDALIPQDRRLADQITRPAPAPSDTQTDAVAERPATDDAEPVAPSITSGETIVETARLSPHPPIATPNEPQAEPIAPQLAQETDPQADRDEEIQVFALRRSVFPRARPEASEPTVSDEDALTAVLRSRLPRERPETVARLASLPAADVLSTALPQQNGPMIAASAQCGREHTRAIPNRRRSAPTGSGFIAGLTSVSGRARDVAVLTQVLAGNIPRFERNLVPVRFEGRDSNGRRTEVTICVMPDYLAVGSNDDFVRVPLGLPAATRVAARFDMVLPTTEMVDAIYRQASLRLSPSPMEPGAQMASTRYFMRHNQTLEQQRRAAGGRLGQLVSGHKKDLVLSNRLASRPGRVAIYGWHRRNGRPIQPLSTVHGAQYADYSHGIRLISRHAYVNGRRVDLRDVLGDSNLAGLVSNEGTIRNRNLLAALD